MPFCLCKVLLSDFDFFVFALNGILFVDDAPLMILNENDWILLFLAGNC